MIGHHATIGPMMAVGAGVPISKGDILSEGFDSLSGWAQTKLGNATIIQTNAGGQEVIEISDSGWVANNFGQIFQGSMFSGLPSPFTLTHNGRCSKLPVFGVDNNLDQLDLYYGTPSKRLLIRWYSNRLVVFDSGGPVEYPYVFSDLGNYFSTSFEITHAALSATTDIYIGNQTNSEKIATGADIYRADGVTPEGSVFYAGSDKINEPTRMIIDLNELPVGTGFEA